MIAAYIQCPNCRSTLLDERMFNQPGVTPCPRCGNPIQIEVFPAFFRQASAPNGNAGEMALVDGESTCFYHASKKALLPCEGCGRFLCALCDCDLNGRHFCPACLEAGKTKGRIKNLENRRTLWDGVALALAVYPIVTLVFWIFSIFTAPIALFIAIRYWNAPRSIFHRTKIRYILAILFSSIEILAWIAGIYFATRTT